MICNFKTNAASLPVVEFRPFMVETAYDYFKTVYTSKHERGFVREALGALAIEIVLKSYMAKATENFFQLDEKYEFNRMKKSFDPHNLNHLAQNLPPMIRSYLLDAEGEKVIDMYQNAFKSSRYGYEGKAKNFFSDDPLYLAAKLICKTIYLYQQQGCNDPFIKSIDIDKIYHSVVQPFVLIKQ